MTAAGPRSRLARPVIAVAIALLASAGTGRLASAHTDFESSNPADGETVDAPLTEIVVNFTNPSEPAGDGFELVDPSGAVTTPSSIDETDGTSFLLTFDPPLDEGTYGLRWSVRAGDAHPIEGAFRFEVVSAATTTIAPAASGPVPPPSAGTAMGDADHAAMSDADHAAMSDESLDALLDVASTTDDAVPVGRVGRTMSMLGTVVGLGALAALVWTIRGRRDELTAQLTWVRVAGLVVFTGGLVELAALAESDPASSLGELLTSKPGVAAVLKMAGGAAVVIGFHRGAGRIVAPAHSLSAAVATDLSVDAATDPASGLHGDGGDHRWIPTATAALGVLGYALVLASFWFDGHTVSRGPWAIHSAVNFVHLLAAAVWGGGVFAMTTTAWTRRRRSERIGVAAMVVRFSSIATAALIAVTLAGAAMAWLILETPADLFTTTWGRLLVAKVAVVAVAAGLGGYNHFRLRPALEQRPDDPQLAKELRTSLTIESAAFAIIVALTAFLVAAAT